MIPVFDISSPDRTLQYITAKVPYAHIGVPFYHIVEGPPCFQPCSCSRCRAWYDDFASRRELIQAPEETWAAFEMRHEKAQRVAYYLAAYIVSGFNVTLARVRRELLLKCNFPNRRAITRQGGWFKWLSVLYRTPEMAEAVQRYVDLFLEQLGYDSVAISRRVIDRILRLGAPKPGEEEILESDKAKLDALDRAAYLIGVPVTPDTDRRLLLRTGEVGAIDVSYEEFEPPALPKGRLNGESGNANEGRGNANDGD